MQGSLIHVVMPVVVVLGLFVMIALPFAGARGSGDRHSGGHEPQGQIPGHSPAPDAFGSKVIGLGHAQQFVTANGHVRGVAAGSGVAARTENTRAVTSQPPGGKSSMP